VADQYIATHAAAGDLVVTQDVPLAAQLVPKEVTVLDPRGEEHTAESVSASRYATSWIRHDCLGSLRAGRRPTMHGPSRPLPRRWTERLRAHAGGTLQDRSKDRSLCVR
jgi:hypothetical protein